MARLDTRCPTLCFGLYFITQKILTWFRVEREGEKYHRIGILLRFCSYGKSKQSVVVPQYPCLIPVSVLTVNDH